MEINYNIKRDKTFNSMWRLYFMIYYCLGVLPVNIDNLLLNLAGSTQSGIGVSIASYLIVATISVLIFGYFSEKISEKISRKKLFILTNSIWIVAYGLISLSVNFYFYLIFTMVGAIGIGAFLPIGFSMIGDFYSPKTRGKKFGGMHLGLILGNGMGIIFGGLLGSYTGPFGWRFAYGLGFGFGLISLISYIISGINPERGRAEPEFKDIEGKINYNFKITFKELGQIFKKKSTGAILISVLCSGVAVSTFSYWGIFYLTSKINDVNAELYGTTLYILAGIGSLPGTVIGGKLGDYFFQLGKPKGRVLVSMCGLILGIIFFSMFYFIPFFTATPLQVAFSWIFFVFVGLLGYFFTTFNVGNQFAIYSDVCVPELRSTINALNGLMMNIGGIIGNLLLSSLIEDNIALLQLSLSLGLFIWLFGTFFWVISFFYYPKELHECRDLMNKRRIELEKR